MTDPINEKKDSVQMDATKEKNLQSIIPYVTNKVFKSISDLVADPEKLITEYKLIKEKKSNLSRQQRDCVIKYVEQWLPIVEKMMAEGQNEVKDDKADTEKSVIVKND